MYVYVFTSKEGLVAAHIFSERELTPDELREAFFKALPSANRERYNLRSMGPHEFCQELYENVDDSMRALNAMMLIDSPLKDVFEEIICGLLGLGIKLGKNEPKLIP